MSTHRRAAALELVMTAIMLFIAVTATRWLMVTIDSGSGGWWNTPQRRLLAVAPIAGYTVTAFMLSPWGRATGGHLNPAISLAMWRYGRTPGRDVLPFITAQLLGSVVGTAAARLAWGPAIAGRATDYAAVAPAPGWSWAAVAAVEAGTMFVIVAVAGIGISSRRLGRYTPWAVGTLITAQIIAFGTHSGGVANPAREFGPALLSGRTALLPVYLLAPVIGSLAAATAVRRAQRRPSADLPSPTAIPPRTAAVGAGRPSTSPSSAS
ncbi:aquaporin [Streptacidiphilus sp. N1-10]|uniref:Aquaporin n=1 Tax=Streptacidiphilus jeojiensis TaxID=3229225 RepID=A0ABV6XF65_9ACTN